MSGGTYQSDDFFFMRVSSGQLMDGLFYSLSFFMVLTLRLVKRFVQKKLRGKAVYSLTYGSFSYLGTV